MKFKLDAERKALLLKALIKPCAFTIATIIGVCLTADSWSKYGLKRGFTNMTQLIDEAGCRETFHSYISERYGEQSEEKEEE